MPNKIISVLHKGCKNFFKNPIFFLLRQIYRIIIVIPFEALVTLVWLFVPKKKLNLNEPKSFCFLVTSVIYPKLDKKITYGSVRSVFDPEERAKQTLKTIESIRDKVPQAKIILIEAGLKRDLPFALNDKVDNFIYIGDKRTVRWACDSRFKSLGEAAMLLYVAETFKEKVDFYFKISGRYFLNENFNINEWRQGQFLFYFRPDLEEYISTRLYGFRNEMKMEWKLALIKGVPLSLIGYAIENTLVKFVPRKYIARVNRLGVTGVGASVKDLLVE